MNTLSSIFKLAFKSCLFSLILILITQEVNGQNNLSVPFNSGFVGNVSGNNAASNCQSMSSLGWSNIYFSQTTTSTVFVAQGNDIIGNVVLTDAAGTIHTIPGYIKWRAPSGSPTSLVFSPSSSATLATSGGANYSINSTKYIGLIFNGQTLNLASGNVSGNAAINGLLDVLNSYLAVFPSISIMDYTVNESVGSVIVAVSLSQSTSSEVRVSFSYSNGSASAGTDYASTSGQLVFAPNQLTASISVSIFTDLLSEATEQFNITLFAPVNASIQKSTSQIIILDNPPLPVELAFFESECAGDGVELTWATFSELNSQSFIIDKKAENSDWRFLTEVNAKGNSSEQIDYSFTDVEKNSGISYYRLTQVDKDGKERTYDAISSSCKSGKLDFEIFPNPSLDKFYLDFYSGIQGLMNVTVSSIEGTVVFLEKHEKLSEQLTVDLSHLPLGPGLYLVKCSIENEEISKMFLKQ
jgi:hypothetical protein